MKGLANVRDNMDIAEVYEYRGMQVVDADPVIPAGTKVNVIHPGIIFEADQFAIIENALEIMELETIKDIRLEYDNSIDMEVLASFALTDIGAVGVNICEFKRNDEIMCLPYAMLEYADIETETPENEIREKDITYEHHFTSEEIADKNEGLHKLLTDLFEVEAHKKEITSSLGAKIKGYLEEIKFIHEAIACGFETRMTLCEEIKDYATGMVRYVDSDGIVLKEREMEDSEKQLSMNN